MENLVYLDRNELAQVVRAEVAIALKSLIPEKKEERQRLTVDEALIFCGENGYHLPKSTLYKFTSAGDIPFMRVGKRKVMFDRQELREWIEKKTRKVV